MKRFLLLILTLALLTPAFAQQSNAERAYSPTQFGMNAITLPASNVTADSTVIPMNDVNGLTLLGSCTQAAKLSIRLYQEDGTTSLTTIDVDTTITAAAITVLNLSENAAPAVSGSGTVASGLRLPLLYASFFFTNSGATPGTCTARLRVSYQ